MTDSLHPDDLTPQAVALARALAERVVMRFCDGGERVEHGATTTACDYCEAGRCRQMQACEVPL